MAQDCRRAARARGRCVRGRLDRRARYRDRREHDRVQRVQRLVPAAAAVSRRRPARHGLRLVSEVRPRERRHRDSRLPRAARAGGVARGPRDRHAVSAHARRATARRIVLQVARASPSLFDVLRTPPGLGRAFTEDEAMLGNDRVVVLSHRLWSTRFGARRTFVGSDIRLDGGTLSHHRRDARGFRLPEPQHRRLCAVRVHAAANERRRARQSVFDQRRAASRRRDRRRLGTPSSPRSCSATSPRGGCPPTRSTVAGFTGRAAAAARTPGRRFARRCC